MSKIIAGLVLFLTLYICARYAERKQPAEVVSSPHVSLDTSKLKHTKQVYVPVHFQGKTKAGLPAARASLKIRNTSFLDSIYVSRVEYYDTQGRLLKNFIDSALLVKPMATTEITVKSNEFKTPGDNFIVQWHSKDSLHKPIIQVVSLDRKNNVLTTDYGLVIDQGTGIN